APTGGRAEPIHGSARHAKGAAMANAIPSSSPPPSRWPPAKLVVWLPLVMLADVSSQTCWRSFAQGLTLLRQAKPFFQKAQRNDSSPNHTNRKYIQTIVDAAHIERKYVTESSTRHAICQSVRVEIAGTLLNPAG